MTGAASEMGLTTAEAFAAAGASVLLADVQEALRATMDRLTAAGHAAIGMTADVSDEAQAAAIVARRGRVRLARHDL